MDNVPVNQRDIVDATLRDEEDEAFIEAVNDVDKAVKYAKKILMANKVQNFTSGDVSLVASLILKRLD